MDKDAYIRQLETENAELKKRIEELERLLGINSKNSSKPPSSDPPGMSATKKPRHRRKKRGARKGHQPHLRELLPQEFVKEHFHLKPEVCTCGSTNIEKADEEPLRHQIVDIPPINPEVTEYVQFMYRCKDCGELVYQRRMPELQKRVESLLKKGACFDGKLSGKCRRILTHKKYLWTFVKDRKVEPTNNFAERIVRQGVLWRKNSFGTQSQRGARYVERVLTVCTTCQLQGRSIIEYLRDVCHCHLNSLPVPSLIKPEDDLTQSA